MSGAISTPFTIYAAAYWAARGAYEQHRADCTPADPDDPLHHACDDACGPLVSAMHEAATCAVKVPAQSQAEFLAKVAIYEFEGLFQDGDLGRVRLLLDYFVDDIKALAPGAYPKGIAA